MWLSIGRWFKSGSKDQIFFFSFFLVLSVVQTKRRSNLIDCISVVPSIAQLVERWTVEVVVIHRSLVQIRLEGSNLFFFLFFLVLSVVQTKRRSNLIDCISVVPSIAQLVERWTVEVVVIHRSLVRIRLEGLIFSSA